MYQLNVTDEFIFLPSSFASQAFTGAQLILRPQSHQGTVVYIYGKCGWEGYTVLSGVDPVLNLPSPENKSSQHKAKEKFK